MPPPLTIRQLVRLADDWLYEGDGYSDLGFVCQYIHGSDEPNSHLGLPLRDNGIPFERREKPLSENEMIHGDIFTFEFEHHSPMFVIRNFESLEAAANYICFHSGVLGPYVSFVVAFVNGDLMPYQLSYDAQDGRKFLTNQELAEGFTAGEGNQIAASGLEIRWGTTTRKRGITKR